MNNRTEYIMNTFEKTHVVCIFDIIDDKMLENMITINYNYFENSPIMLKYIVTNITELAIKNKLTDAQVFKIFSNLKLVFYNLTNNEIPPDENIIGMDSDSMFDISCLCMMTYLLFRYINDNFDLKYFSTDISNSIISGKFIDYDYIAISKTADPLCKTWYRYKPDFVKNVKTKFKQFGIKTNTYSTRKGIFYFSGKKNLTKIKLVFSSDMFFIDMSIIRKKFNHILKNSL